MMLCRIEFHRLVLFVACLGFSTLASSQNIEVIDLGLDDIEGSGEIFDTPSFNYLQTTLTTSVSPEHSSSSASVVLEPAVSLKATPIFNIFPTSVIENLDSGRDNTVSPSVKQEASYAAHDVASASPVSSILSSSDIADPRQASSYSVNNIMYPSVRLSTNIQPSSTIVRPTQSLASVYIEPSESSTQFTHNTVTPTLSLFSTDLSPSMVLEPKSSDLPLGSSQIFQVGDTDFSTSRVSSALPLGASDLFASDNVAVSKVILSSNPPELQSSNVRETITVKDNIMSTPTTTGSLSSTLQTSTPGLWTRTPRISEVDPTSSISDYIFPSKINQYLTQISTGVSEMSLSSTSKSFLMSIELEHFPWEMELTPSENAAQIVTNYVAFSTASLFDQDTSMPFFQDQENSRTTPTLLRSLFEEYLVSSEIITPYLSSSVSDFTTQYSNIASHVDFSSKAMGLSSLTLSSAYQSVEIFTPGVSLTKTESFRPLRSSDIFHDSPHNTVTPTLSLFSTDLSPSMVLEPKSTDLPLGSTQIFQVGGTDFSTSRVSSELPLRASELFASDNEAVSKVILPSDTPELQSLNVRETITVQDIMSTPATTEWLSSTLQTFTPGLWTRTSRISEVDPTSSISDDIFPSEINQYWSQNVEIFTAGVSLTETESFRPLRSSDIFHESPNVTRYMFSSPSSSVFETINLSSTSRAFTSSSLDFSVPNSSVQDVYIASLSQVESQDYETTASSFVTLTPTLSTVDLLKSLSLELNTLDESSILTLSDSSISPTFIIDVSETSQLEASSKLSNQVAFSLSPTRRVSESIFSDVFIPASSVITDLTPTLASEILHPTPFRHTNETFQSLTASTNIQIETIPFTQSTAVVATVLNISSAYSLPIDINTIEATPTISLTAEHTSSSAIPEKSLSTVEPSSMPSTTSPVPVVAPLVDVTFAFKFRVDGQCLRLRQAPYSRHFKTSLARTLLHITHLKSSSGSKVRVEEAQCNTNPHIISVSFFKIDKHSLIHAINSTHTFYGNKHKKFTLPIEVKFSAESKAFVVNITGFEEIKGLGQTKSKSSIFGMDTAAIATAACLCVVLVCVGTCVFAREMYLKRRVDCMDVSGRFSHVPTYNIKEKAAELTHTSGMYKGGKTGIDNPALCSSVYNDIEMTEVYLDDTEGDDDSSYYNPYDVEYSSIGNNFMVEFDAFGTSGKLHGIMNSAFSLSSVEDVSTTSNVDELPKHGRAESSRQAVKQPPPPRNYGLVIGLLGYNKQQAQQPRQDEWVPQSMNTEKQIPNTSYGKQRENQDHKNQGTSVEESIYTVPMKYPRKSRRNSRKRPSLQVMMSDPGSATETSLSVHRDQKPSPVAPPRRQKTAPRSQQEQRRAKADDRNSQRGGKAKRSVSREDSTRSGQKNRSFVEDEVYAVISGSTQSFHF